MKPKLIQIVCQVCVCSQMGARLTDGVVIGSLARGMPKPTCEGVAEYQVLGWAAFMFTLSNNIDDESL